MKKYLTDCIETGKMMVGICSEDIENVYLFGDIRRCNRHKVTKKPVISRGNDRLISFLQLCYSSGISIDGFQSRCYNQCRVRGIHSTRDSSAGRLRKRVARGVNKNSFANPKKFL